LSLSAAALPSSSLWKRGTRVWCGFSQFGGTNNNLRPRFRYQFPTERHFHSELGILPILVRLLSLVESNDQNVRFQKPAQNENFFRLSARAHFLAESEGLRRLLPRLYPRPLALGAAAIFLQEAA
jgi:hypothetical protein